MDLNSLPKVELHLHLDCSLSYQVVNTIDPSISREEYRKKFKCTPNCRDLSDYINRAVYAIDLMQTPEQLRLVTLDLFEQLKSDNVLYAEIRFAPLEHTRDGMTPRQVVRAVNDAMLEGERETGIHSGLILCTLRHYSERQSRETVELVEQFSGTRVVGFDIAADEAGYPIDNHKSAFRYAREKGINCTAHAGEACGADSVWETLEQLRPQRIGHGVRSIEDPELVTFLKEKNIHLEVCPTSNLHTHVFDHIREHSLDKLYRAGVSLSINTDGRTISDVSLTEEYGKLQEVFDWSREQLLKCNLEAAEHAFTTERIKEELRSKLLAAY